MSQSMFQATHTELEKLDVFNKQLPEVAERIVEAIPFPTVPARMKATIAINELTTFASQFRRNISLWDGTLVPINSISFVITGSGEGKDSSVRAARKCFKDSYSTILDKRKELAKREAINKAREAGEDQYEEPETYFPYMSPQPPIFISPTTGPGFIQHINDLGEHSLGAGLIYSGEFGDELAYNQDMTECIKVLSETYDLGEKEVKYTKGAEHRSKEISGQPVSALMVGSPAYLLYDEAVKKKFQIAFMSKLARRSWFCYTPESIPEIDYKGDIDAMIAAEEAIEAIALNARSQMVDGLAAVTQFGIKTVGNNIGVTEEVARLFKVYKRYNSELAKSLPNQHSTSVLVRKHLQWKALKLAGALAIFRLSNNIELEDYVAAIRFAELMSEDMGLFEAELAKADYERFADYIHTIVDSSGHASITAHDVKKLGFVKTISKTSIQTLITSASSYDFKGIYTYNKDCTEVFYEAIIKTDVIGISHKPIDNSALFDALEAGKSKADIDNIKSRIATTANYGLENVDSTFDELGELLQGDYAYSPFKFKNGTRSRDGILGGTKWVVLDVDDSQMTAEEAHFLLSDINHHIALTSDPSNEFKFRVLLELDSVVDVDAVVWKHFYRNIADFLAINVDPLPQSQIFFSYSGRPVYSVTDAQPIEVRDFLMAAHEQAKAKAAPNVVLTTAQKQALIDDELTTFDRAFNASMGEGSRSMIWAARKAFFQLGMSHDDTINLIQRINNYWYSPLSDERLERTIIQQIKRF